MKKFFLILASLVLLVSCGNSQTTETTTSETVVSAENKAKLARTTDGAIAYGEGPARIQVFADFQCPYCQQADKSTTPILESLAEAGKITLEYRQLPLAMHKNAFDDANAALCVADQNLESFRAYKSALYALETSKAGGSVKNSERIALAEKLGIATDSLKNCIENGEKSDAVKAEQSYAASFGITGTPTYYLDGKPFNASAYRTAEAFEEFIDLYISQKYPTTVTTETPADAATTVSGTESDEAEGNGGVVEIAPEDATTTATGETIQK